MFRMKYHNKKISTEDGVFDSKLELARWKFLRKMENDGHICQLERQKQFELIPKQTEWVVVKLKTKSNLKERLLERPVYYKADFTYDTDYETVVEDTKGFKTPDYIIKRKLMLRVHGIQIKEVKKANEPIGKRTPITNTDGDGERRE